MNKTIFRKGVFTKIILMLLVGTLLALIWVEREPKEKEKITIVVYDAGTNGWNAMQEGVRQAAEDFSVSTKFIVMKENASASEQMEIIQDAVADGAKGILLAADDSEDIRWALEKNPPGVPVVAVENGVEDSDVICVSADDYAMGKLLAEEILTDFLAEESLRIVLDESEEQRQNVKLRRQGFIDSVGTKAQIVSYNDWDKQSADIIVALHKKGLENMLEKADTFPETVKLYGIGGTATLVSALDQGKIEKIVFQNEFSVGYLGMDVLIEKLRNKGTKQVPQIAFYSSSREDLYDPQREQLLFTIIE